jgi:microcystin-dependent protein
MAYTVSFTDSTNPAKPPITVADGALNNQTSLTFPGKNYSGYAPILAGDFLHLLENFAAATAPGNPVQGQLWYDTSSGNNILRVYDGTTWVEAGNLKKAPFVDAPSPVSSVAGDLWVDTTNSQLYLFTGSNWTLVGPTYSAGLQTGPVVESIVDTANITRAIISMYVASADNKVSYRVAIISKDTFTPKSSIDGFQNGINEGINLYSNSLTGDTATVWGTVQAANSLNIKNVAISAANFLRSDVSSTTNSTLNIQNAGGISIGTDLSFNIAQGNNVFTFYSKNSSNSVEFNVNGSTLLHLDSNGNIGIGAGNINPTSPLSVAGIISSGVAGTPGGIVVNDGASPTPSTILSVSTSGISTTLNSTFTSNVTVNGLVTTGLTGTLPSGPVLLPAAAGIYDIGSQSLAYRNVYADSFVGNFSGSFTGTVIGNVTGTADSLKTPTVFSVAGDMISSDLGVSFTGQSITGTAILNTQVSSTMITGKTAATAAQSTDQILVFQTNTSGSALKSMTREVFLNGVGAYAIPIASIMPFAGPSSAIPPGWLMCDGSEISTVTYNQLFLSIGYIYGAQNTLLGANTFKLPDLRGRFALGLDNMNNYGNVTGFVQAKTGGTPPVNVNTGGQIGPAGRVSNIAADTLGGNSGSQNVVLNTTQLPQHTHSLNDGTAQYYAPGVNGGITDNNASYGNGLPATSSTGYGLENTAGVNSSSIGQAVTVMNPYLSINYIIFTGNV